MQFNAINISIILQYSVAAACAFVLIIHVAIFSWLQQVESGPRAPEDNSGEEVRPSVTSARRRSRQGLWALFLYWHWHADSGEAGWCCRRRFNVVCVQMRSDQILPRIFNITIKYRTPKLYIYIYHISERWEILPRSLNGNESAPVLKYSIIVSIM